jgi:hypothetical protein
MNLESVLFILYSAPPQCDDKTVTISLSIVSNNRYSSSIRRDHTPPCSYLMGYFVGVHIVEIFWGLWFLPFGYLVYKLFFYQKHLQFWLHFPG